MDAIPRAILLIAKRSHYCLSIFIYDTMAALLRKVPIVEITIFEKILRYLDLDPSDRRAKVLKSLFVDNFTKTQAAEAFGMTNANVGLLTERVLRDLRRAGDLTGVYIEPVIRRGVPGRKARNA